MNRYIFVLLAGVSIAAVLLLLFVHMNAAYDQQGKPAPGSAPRQDAAMPSGTGVPTAPENAPAAAPPAAGGAALVPAAPVPPSAASSAARPGGSTSAPATPPAARPGGASGINTPPPAASASSSAASPPASASVERGAGQITGISLHFRSPGMALRLEASSPLPVKYFILSQPDRLVVDLPGRWRGLKTPEIPSNNLIRSIRVGRQGDADRLVLDMLVPLKKHEIRRLSDNLVEVYFQ
ncbi:MAG: AMIN domain-containing protein [Deltaproteobacteria bacterium]|jgi:hypothetical protein|nr:AMIN domain-containing protein [Deltaproteobacteria bacterium]